MTATLGAQVSKKISAWILIFVVTIIVSMFFASFFLSQRMFDKQINIWNTLIPQQALTNLIDSDDFPITKEAELIKSTELFSSFVITDNHKRIISQFGTNNHSDKQLIPIKDNANFIWGYYSFKPNYNHFIVPFAFGSGIFLFLIFCIYFIFRWRIRVSLEIQFSQFNNFLKEIESVTQQLHLIYREEFDFKSEVKSVSHEQDVINKAISKLIEEIRKANKSLCEAIAKAEQRHFQEELTRMALQVAHDIGSPLAILTVIQSTSSDIPEKTRIIIRNATSKIRDITNVFLKKARHDLSFNEENQILQPQMLVQLIEQIVSEKRIQHGDRVNIDLVLNDSSHKIFSLINPVELNRVLSNLINNSVDAVEHNKKIIVALIELNNEAVIQVKDHGRGIPKKNLNQIGELGASFGKTQGTGLGLNHAIQTIKNCGGRLVIRSEERVGTTVQLFLPMCQSPSWFISEIKVRNNQQIIVIDDDENIHAVWERKFNELQKIGKIQLSLTHLYSPHELLDWKAKNIEVQDVLFLCDYEFSGTNLNGIDLIKQIGIDRQSILVTSRLDSDVITRCESEKIKLIPKSITQAIIFTINYAEVREEYEV